MDPIIEPSVRLMAVNASLLEQAAYVRKWLGFPGMVG
jgi:hypothetical protein